MEHLKLITMRVWELRDHGDRDEYRDSHRMGMREYEDAHEAYECGYEDGYEAAMEEMEEGKASHRMGQRSRMY
jgi:flagellar biosynthesis/type III secretory pathway protein FliH